MAVFEWDDFGANHVISDMCQSHDCRDKLLELKEINPDFKATLFAIPGEMTYELLEWSKKNKSWVELAYHGIFHSSNYECERMTYNEFNFKMTALEIAYGNYFVQGFRAPGWQISDGIYRWLQERDWWIGDQGYNDDRRPAYMDAFVNYGGKFKVLPRVGNPYDVEVYHGHTWDVGWNGIYEDFEKVKVLVNEAKDFQFVSELF